MGCRRTAASAVLFTPAMFFTPAGFFTPRWPPAALIRLSVRALIARAPSGHRRDRHRGLTLGTRLRRDRGRNPDTVSGTDLRVARTANIER